MYDIDIKKVARQIRRKWFYRPERFYCLFPGDRGPVVFVLNGLRYWQRSILRSELEHRGFSVKYWQAPRK